ncbi:EthD family reductase [Hyphomicrobium sp.]|uniref:EthD family reductase n=1 Tax=Hyphomicrobium sp. TaxID=82 RepID=UPI001DBFF2F6|nr:EthD family reductase [Hyphomicrobium sp.]MBY0558821.1 EthD family reductase [Hyphomicrobium sp.]
MIRVTVIYDPPANPAAFDDHYHNIHVKLVAKMPRLQSFSFSRGAVENSNAERPAHLIAFLDYDSKADLDASLESEEGRAAVADVSRFASGGVTILTAALSD